MLGRPSATTSAAAGGSARQAAGRRSSWFKALFLGLALLAVPLVLEAAARFQHFRVDRFNPLVARRRAEIEALEASGQSIWKIPHWQYLPGAEVRVDYRGREFHATSNRFGFRAPELAVPRPRGVFRIACIGGSTTAEGLTNATTYPEILDALLREAVDGWTIEVVNAGVSGLNSAGEVARLEGLDPSGRPDDSPTYLSLDPNLLVEYGAVNDICWRLFPLWKARAELAHPWLSRLARHSHFVRRVFHDWLVPSPAQAAADLEAATLVNLERLGESARARGVEIVFCTFARPDLESLTSQEREFYEHDVRVTWGGEYFSLADYAGYVDLYNRQLRALCQKKGWKLIPLDAALRGGSDVFSDICHCSPEGIRRKAEILAEHLRPYLEEKLAAGKPGR